MLATVIAFAVKIGLGGLLDKSVRLLERRAELSVDKEKLRAELTAEHIRQTVEEVRIMADYNKAKLSFPWFWLFASLFIVPLGIWWAAVLLDSVFGFSGNIAHLPNAEMRTWAGDMIRWLFYVGGGVAGIKMVAR